MTLLYIYKLIHALTAAGIIPSHYKRISKFAEMGTAGKQYINNSICPYNSHLCVYLYICITLCPLVHRTLGYFDTVAEAMEASIGLAVYEIEETPDYCENGAVVYSQC